MANHIKLTCLYNLQNHSLSFGQSAIFLIGGQTKAIRPVPLLLNSGDVLIMSGDSRLAYHALPKVLSPSENGSKIPNSLTTTSLDAAISSSNKHTFNQLVCSICGMSNGTAISASNELHNIPSTEEVITTNKDTVSCEGCQFMLNYWEKFEYYLSYSRINVNVRQVGKLSISE